jgi:cobalt-zinc-cadmium resistance protein CzcA
MPAGYYVTYGGQFQNLQEANQRLMIALPIALLLILVLLFFTFGSMKQSLLIFTAIPLSAIGGVFALIIRDLPFSISAGIGFIALFGVAVLNGIVLVAEFNRLDKEGVSDIYERVIKGTRVRLRPVLMTATVAALGFFTYGIVKFIRCRGTAPIGNCSYWWIDYGDCINANRSSSLVYLFY